ncbi:MAG: hypothetical protein R3E76_13075 [Planctomycetota bacterium]
MYKLPSSPTGCDSRVGTVSLHVGYRPSLKMRSGHWMSVALACLCLFGCTLLGCTNESKSDCIGKTYDFIGSSSHSQREYDDLLDCYRRSEKLGTPAGIFLEGPAPAGEEDNWIRIVAFLADRGQERARKRLGYIRVQATETSASSLPLLEYLGKQDGKLLPAWDALTKQKHHYDRTGDFILILDH